MHDKPAKAILVGGLIGGAFDITFACTYATARGGSAYKVLQFVASGLLGKGSFDDGPASAVLGLVLHFVIAIGAATVFYLASRKIAFMTRQPLIAGPLFGACVYLAMNFVVGPLSAAPPFKHSLLGVTLDLSVHMFLLGMSIALAMRRWAPISSSRT
ncbi:MAG TPA: hypothetical protein VL463_30970 [Kofleriaceae bacterium]|jgi:hypothetical protein|nr:hypothetical protein [Kofleriaceae bacterium]